jgi:hypothetical protein
MPELQAEWWIWFPAEAGIFLCVQTSSRAHSVSSQKDIVIKQL